ncbi:hypothetical protein [Rummeliibacillus stabekisii]|nr:hypothetical protein [Rummeliibacillus stabekisii]MBB5170709.1 hypothetical protein [Rummeliibacillus stabekisii]GEL06203.1 hypothetical protein RST01_28300 [Rummeliibacillus stabekisii]
MKITRNFADDDPIIAISQTFEVLFDTYIEQFYAYIKVNSTTSSDKEDV